MLHIPAMDEAAAAIVASAFRWIGIEAQPTPPSTAATMSLGSEAVDGDVCYPAQVTMGDLLSIIDQPGFDASRTAFFMATSDGPCRFGQYAVYLRKLLRARGHGEIEVVSPSDKDGYVGFGDVAGPLFRTIWRGIVAADILRRLLLMSRPHEIEPGSTELAFRESLVDFRSTVESSCARPACQLRQMVASLIRARGRFRNVRVNSQDELPLIGVVGEIFCRLNTFSNQELIRMLESYGAETSLSGISEWVHYVNAEELRLLRLRNSNALLRMLGARLRQHVQHADEETLLSPFRHDFERRPECRVDELLSLARPYLPAEGVSGEMVLSVGKAAWLALQGADGVVDISPFTCMNGIVSEAIYPRVSKDYGGIPIRNFYFDGTRSDLDRDVGIYMELARSYRESKLHRLHDDAPAYESAGLRREQGRMGAYALGGGHGASGWNVPAD
jgi:predicted nucleotide-binding protein (sugar kinase/HSP70/actin superfamily)